MPLPAHLDQSLVARELRIPPVGLGLAGLALGPPGPAADDADDADVGSTDSATDSEVVETAIVDCSVQGSADKQYARTVRRLELQCWRQRTTIVALQKQLREAKRAHQLNRVAREEHCCLVALARNRHHSSAAAVAAWSEDLGTEKAMSQWSIPRWEIKVGTAVITSMQHFHRDMEALLAEAGRFKESCPANDDDEGWDVVITDLAGDATKSGAWRTNKLQCLCLRTTFCIGNDVTSKVCWPDVLVADNGSVNGCWRLVLKQLRLTKSIAMDPLEGAARLHRRQLRMTHVCGDCGTDQVGYRTRLARACKPFPYIFFTAVPCIMHQGQLGSCRVLGMVDVVLESWHMSFRYYSTLVQLCHLLRNCVEHVSKMARRRFGVGTEQAKHWAKKIPQCIAGRWLSVLASEKFILSSLSWEEFRQLLSDAFFHNCPDFEGFEGDSLAPDMADEGDAEVPLADAPHAAASAAKPQDHIALDEMKAHQEKQTKYRAYVRRATEQREFWMIMKLAFQAKKGFDHLLCFLQTNLEDPNTTSHLSLLTCGKAKEIAEEIESVLDLEDWDLEVAAARQIFPEQVWGALVTLICVAASEFHWRVRVLVEEWPWLLMCYSETPYDVESQERRQLSEALLSRPIQTLDITTAKVRELFRSELEACACTGKIPHYFWQLIIQWRIKARCSVQLIESCNSIITRTTSAAPRIENPLLSARITIKQEIQTAMGDGISGHEAVLQIMDIIRANYKTEWYQELHCLPDRFADLDAPKNPLPIMAAAELPANVEVARPLGLGPLEADAADADCDQADCSDQAEQDAARRPERAPGHGGGALPSEYAPGAAPWSKCPLLGGAQLPPEADISDAEVVSAARAALRWSYNWSAATAEQCFWFGEENLGTDSLVSLPKPGDVAFLCVPCARYGLPRPSPLL